MKTIIALLHRNKAWLFIYSHNEMAKSKAKQVLCLWSPADLKLLGNNQLFNVDCHTAVTHHVTDCVFDLWICSEILLWY